LIVNTFETKVIPYLAVSTLLQMNHFVTKLSNPNKQLIFAQGISKDASIFQVYMVKEVCSALSIIVNYNEH